MATIEQTPRSPQAQTLARRHRSRVWALAGLCHDVAAVPDLQQTHPPVLRSRLHAAKPEALHHDVGLILPRPSPASANARDQLDPPHLRDAATGSGRLASKLTLKRNVKIIAHGSALRHNPDTTETWERSPAYGLSRERRGQKSPVPGESTR